MVPAVAQALKLGTDHRTDATQHTTPGRVTTLRQNDPFCASQRMDAEIPDAAHNGSVHSGSYGVHGGEVATSVAGAAPPSGWQPGGADVSRPLPGGGCEVSGDDVRGVPVQVAAGPVMPRGDPRVSIGRRFPRVAHVPYRASRPRMAAP